MAGRTTDTTGVEPRSPVSAKVTYDLVLRATEGAGLIVMGAQHPRLSGAKNLDQGTLVLLGTAGAFWPILTSSSEWKDGQPDPVDRFSARVVGEMSQDLGARAWFPFGGPPYAPFIDWALKSGRTFQSPVGALVHDTVGMMVSFRGALHFDTEFDIPPTNTPSPCLSCPAPCATACPVGALNADTFYDVDACHGYLDTSPGQSCMTNGCAARLACPLSAGAGRQADQSAHHMKAFHPR